MSCSDQISPQDLINAKLDAITIGEIATSKEGAASGGADIDSSTNRFGKSTPTMKGRSDDLDTKEAQYTDDLNTSADAFEVLAAQRVSQIGIIYDSPIRDWTPSLLVDDLRAHRYPATTGDIYIPTKELSFTTGATFNAADWELYQGVTPSDIDNDLSIVKVFDTVALFKASLIEFPNGKTIHLNDRDADFTKITGNTPTDDEDIVFSTNVNQSIELPASPIVTVESLGGFTTTNITTIISNFMNNAKFQTLECLGLTYDIDESYPYHVDKKTVLGNENYTIFNYVGAAGTVGNLVEVVKLRKSGDLDAVDAGSFKGIIIDLNDVDYLQGISARYFTNESYIGEISVENTSALSEALVVDRLWYTHWGAITIRNNPAFKVGKGFVFRPTVDANSSINSHSIPQVELIGLADPVYIDTSIAQINTIKMQGSVEACTNGVTYVDGLGINEAEFSFHMEGNVRNVNWIGTSSGGPGLIKWSGTWNDTAGGDLKFGSSHHYITARMVGSIDLFKWSTARVSVIGGSVVGHGGESGNENGGPVDFTDVEETSSFPGWRERKQGFVGVTKGQYVKGASTNTLATTTGFVEFDFSEDLQFVASYGAVKISVAYLRPDGSRKAYNATALKRPADATNYLLTSTGGDALDASFDVELTVSGLLRVKSAINESILYVGRVDPF